MDVQICDERAYGKLTSEGIRDVIRDAFSETLCIENDQVNTDLSFMALGGDSFQAIKLYQKFQAEALDISFQQILGQTFEEIVIALTAHLDHLETSAALQHPAAPVGNSQSAGCSRFPMLDRDHDLGHILSTLTDRNLSIDEVESIYPASNMQESMYVAQQMGSEQNIIYQTRGLFSIPADVDLWALNYTWTKIIERHQSLRTTFVETSECSAGHLLYCVVLRELPKSVPAISEDFTCTTLEDVRKDLKIPCEYSTLNYVHQIKVYSGLNSETMEAFKRRRICKIEIPHMAVDGASLCILLDELRQGLLSNGTVFQELPLPTQYEAYIEYDQDVQRQEDAALDYWTEYLADAVPCHVPSICAPPAAGGIPHNAANNSSLRLVATGAENTLHLSVSYSDLRAFCRRQNVTISNAIQAAWAVLLFTYTGQSDICYGYLASGRNVPIRGASEIVGPMMNMLVSRVGSVGSLSVGDLVTKLRDDFVISLPHQTVTLHKVQGLLGLGGLRLFNTIVTSYYAPLMLLDDNGEQNPVRLLESHNASNFDLVVKAVYSDDDIQIRLVYSASAFSSHAAKAVAKTFESILHRMITTPGVNSEAVDSIDVISPEDHAVISEWNRKSCELVDEKTLKPACIHDLITDRARLQPLAPAVCAWDGSSDYQTLDRISTDVALQICSMGIGPGIFIPLCFDKSTWFPVALLAVLKSGNTFVPFDPSNPSARISKMMGTLNCDRQEDGILPLMLCSRTQRSRCSPLARRVLVVDGTCAERSGPSGQLPGGMERPRLPSVTPSNPAYVMFTSGSTGIPKGVVVEHRSYSFAARAHRSGLGLDETSRVLQFASYGFDTCIEDHLSTLISGGCLCIPSEADRLDLNALVDFTRTSRANWAHLVPSLADTLKPADLPSIKTMVLGGEPMTTRNVLTWARPDTASGMGGDHILTQVYGPSECCVTSSITSPVAPESPTMDIGTAVPGCALWITRGDCPDLLCPVGVAGELLVEGPILARGYLGQPDLTAAVFVQGLSWASDETRRFYRTGDIARFVYDSDGNIRLHFVGRKDSQVKINGQRIELGEIERALALQGQVEQGLVTVPRKGPCQNQLVGFISFSAATKAPRTPKTSTGCSSGGNLSDIKLVGGSWRSHVHDTVNELQDSLPPYMVPDLFVCVEELPKNISGKLNRILVQEYVEGLDMSEYREIVSRISDGPDQDNILSGSEIEHKLRTLWSQTLGVPESQILWNTSFFFLGGDSISAMVISQAARQRGIPLTARDIMRHRRIDRLAEAISIEKTPPDERERAPPDRQTDVGSRSIPLSPIQQLHFSTHGLSGDSLDHQTLVLELMKTKSFRSDYQRLLKDIFRQLLKVHPVLRARFRLNDMNKVEQTIATEEDRHNLRLRMHCDSENEYVLDCVREAILSINISEGPLIAVDIFEGGKETNILVSISIHHLVVDTVSWRVVLGELEASLRSNGLGPWHPEPVSFREWSCALAKEFAAPFSGACVREIADDSRPDAIPAREACLDFWEMQGKPNTFDEIVVRTFELDARRAAGLMASCGEDSFTIVDLLCTALSETFYAVFARSPELYVEGHGREPFRDTFADIGGVVGWFSTFAPLGLPFSRDPAAKSWLDVLEQVSLARRRMELNGLAWFSRQQLNRESEKDGHTPMEITVNYLGSFQQVEQTTRSDAMFRIYDHDQFQTRLSDIKRQQRAGSARHSLISAQFKQTEGRICAEIIWNRKMAHQPDLFTWVNGFEAVLVDMQAMGMKTLPLKGTLGEKRPARAASCSVRMEIPATTHTSQETADRILALVYDQFGLHTKDIERLYPCSPIQESIMLSQLKSRQECAPGIYEQQFLFEVIPSDTSNQVDTLRLCEAWRETVQRHAIMRTIFVEDSSGFFQVVLRQHSPNVQAILAREDAVGADDPKPDSMRRELRLGHPLSGSVLHDLTIVERPCTTGGTRVFCTLTKSHLISCGHTSRLLIKVLLDTYDGLDRHPQGQYSHFIEHVFQQDIRGMTKWWSKFLGGSSPCILPRTLREARGVKGKTNAGTSNGSKFLRVGTAMEDTQSLSLACQKHDLSSTSIMCAAWGITLRTYLGNVEDVLFGLMFGGRDLPVPRAHEILGPMINLLPARVRYKEGMRALEVCQQVQGNYLEQLARQTVPLGRIQNAVDSLRGRGQIFNTIVNVQKVRGVQHEQGPNRTRVSMLSSHDTTEYDVALSVTETEHEVQLSIEFCADFMSQAQAGRLLQVFVGLVETIVTSPSCTIDTLELATALDLAQLREWNKTPLKPYRGCIHQMIRATSGSPGQGRKPAISSWDGELTYWELEYLSSSLASAMVARGLRPRDVVALCFEKSVWAVVSMLAVAKAGAAFIQIHPDYPVGRSKAILGQAKPAMGLASHTQQHKLAGVLCEGIVMTVPWSKDCLAQAQAGSKYIDVYSRHTDPSDVMYMISTSGTTGVPKIVVIEHQSFCSAVASNKEQLQLGPDSRVLQFTDYCFDACLEEIFAVLVAGGCICIPSDAQRLSDDMPAFIRRHRVNWAALTPSLLRTLRPDDIAPPVEFITVHAEPMTRALVEAWAGRVKMRPSYGPSECSVTSSVGADFYPGADAANIGRPVGCHAWVVSPDNHDVLMPVGAVGELVLQGPIVGRGYLGDESRTAASFISPPAWAGQFLGEYVTPAHSRLAFRMYKTGDLVRIDPEDGSLLIQGRKDASQVKVRGQRIELEEIDYHLDTVEDIRHGLTMVPQHGELDGRIVAVVSLSSLDATLQAKYGTDGPNQIRVVSIRDLSRADAERTLQSIQRAREALAAHLPRYMLPETWVVVEKLPVTVSHKLDRKQVIQWVETVDRSSLDSVHEFQVHCGDGTQTDALDEEEHKIQFVWGQVLGIDPASVSMDQSFFQLGGNSISAMDIKRRCAALGFPLSTQDVLSMPTVRQLARLAREKAPAVPASKRDPPQSTHNLDLESLSVNFKNTLSSLGGNVESIMRCTPFQTRMYRAFHSKGRIPYVYNHLVKLTPSEQGCQSQISRLLSSWQQTIERHSILRTIFAPRNSDSTADDEVLQIGLKSNSPDCRVFRVSSTDDVLTRSRAHLQNVRQNLFRNHTAPHSLAILVDESDTGALYMHLILSHMLVDHVSLAHIMSDFDLFYRGCDTNTIPPCKPFGDYIAKSYAPGLHDEKSHRVKPYLETALQDIGPCILESRHLHDSLVPTNDAMQSNYQRADPLGNFMASVRFSFDITESVQSLCRDAEVTLSNLLQFAWAVLLHILTGKDAVCFGCLVSDRDRAEGDELEIVGPVLCLLVGRVRFSQSAGSLRDTLRALQKHNTESMLSASSFDLTRLEKSLATRDHERLGTSAVPEPEAPPLLFNTLFNYRKVKYSSPHSGSHRMGYRSLWKEDPHEQDIVLSFNERGDSSLDAEITYHCGMFNDTTIEILGRRYCHVLGILSATRLCSIELVREAFSSM